MMNLVMRTKKYFTTYFNNILLAIIIAITLIGIDQAYRMSNDHLYWLINKSQICIILLISFLLSLFKKTSYALILYGIMVILLFIELLHYSYFGSRISPVEISLFFGHSSEAMQSFTPFFRITLLPFIICTTALIATTLAFYFCKQRSRWNHAWILLTLVFLMPTLRIAFAAITHSVGKDAHVSIGDRPNINDDLWYSTQKTLVFYFFYTLPHELLGSNSMTQALKSPLSVQTKHPDINIIFIMGESLTQQHMSFYGYSRLTTPYLDSLKHANNVIFKNGISSGVSTDISIPLFFNMIVRPDGSKQITSTHRNLFKMAENNGFETHFISTHVRRFFGLIQEYLYPIYINHFNVLGKAKFYATDEALIDYVKTANFTQPTFMVLQPGGSHSPYKWRYPSNYNIFRFDKTMPFKQGQINSYDNSVLYSDHIIQGLIHAIQQKTQRPTYIIFTSDHGESLGDKGVFGHNNLFMKEQHQVPIMIMALNGASLEFMKRKDQEDINQQLMSHYELSEIVAYLLGYKIKHFSMQRTGYYVTGATLDGLGGYNHLKFDNTGKLHNHFNSP